MNLHEGFENESLIINYSDLFSTNVNFSMLPTVKNFASDKTNEPVKLYSLLIFLNAATEDACEKLGLKYQKSSDQINRVNQQKHRPPNIVIELCHFQKKFQLSRWIYFYR